MDRLYFITSNRVKLRHAEFLARDYDIRIAPKPSYGVAYREPRSKNRQYILNRSFEDALQRLKRSSANVDENLFFIEDTSVTIPALSTHEEYPGVDVKYWMQQTTFESLDKMLKDHGNDRRAIVRSDIVLSLPEWLRVGQTARKPFKVFTSRTDGTITNKEFQIATNPLYPWLDNRSFNKWFVPIGHEVPFSCLKISDAESVDFRAGAMLQMLQFLEHSGLICRRTIHRARTSYFAFANVPPVFVICGLPCSGKTTLGKFLSNQCGFYHLEASDFMRVAYLERHGVGSSVDLEEFAESVLIEKPEVVAEKIAAEINDYSGQPIVITGFRSDKELEAFRHLYRGDGRIEEFYLRAAARLRFDRSTARDRGDRLLNFDAFQVRDTLQRRMGLTRIEYLLKKRTFVNERTLNVFIDGFAKRTQVQRVPEVSLRRPSAQRPRLADAIVELLAQLPKSLTTTQIAHQLDSQFSGMRTSKNNVSRYFNFAFYPYFKIKAENGKRFYAITATGRSKARLLFRGKVGVKDLFGCS